MTKDESIQQIARQQLRIETLETQSSDRLDFHDLSVASIKQALNAAYDAGRDELLTAAEALAAVKDNKMETPIEWRALRRAVQTARKTN